MNIKHLSHNLNNDLTILDGYLELLDRIDELPDQAKKIIKKMKIKVDSVKNIFDNVMNPKEEISFKDAFDSYIKMESYPIKCTISGSEFNVISNKKKLEMFFQNIIKNSIEANSNLLKIHLTKNRITIQDNGVGFSDSIMKKINSNKKFTTKINGNGLGLHYLKSFCQEIGLSIEFKQSFTKSGAIIVLTRRKDSS